MITLASLSELSTKVGEYNAAVATLEKVVKLSAIVIYYDGHTVERGLSAEDTDAVRNLLVERQHRWVLRTRSQKKASSLMARWSGCQTLCGDTRMPPRARPDGPLRHEEVRAQLNYNQRTGWLTWRVSKPSVTLGMRAGSLHKSGHRELTICGKVCREHRVVWFWMTGAWPDEKYIDHKNRKRDDNRWRNLRKATHGQNYVNSKTFGPMRGIEIRSPKCFRIRSIINGIRKTFHVKTLVAAKRLRRKLEVQEWGEFACARK